VGRVAPRLGAGLAGLSLLYFSLAAALVGVVLVAAAGAAAPLVVLAAAALAAAALAETGSCRMQKPVFLD